MLNLFLRCFNDNLTEDVRQLGYAMQKCLEFRTEIYKGLLVPTCLGKVQ